MKAALTEQQALQAELKTVDTLLDRGVQVSVPAFRWLRWTGKKFFTFTVARPDSETLWQISGLYLRMKQDVTSLEPETLDEAHLAIRSCMIPASRIVAYGIAPYCTPLGLRNRLLAWFLRRHLDTRQMMELWTMIASLSGAHDFSNFIRSISTVRITKPKLPTA